MLPLPSDLAHVDDISSGVKHDYSGLQPGSPDHFKDLHDYTHPTRPAIVSANKLPNFGYEVCTFSLLVILLDALRNYYQGKSYGTFQVK